MDGNADAAAVDLVWDIAVVETPDVIDAEDFEDVLNADRGFHIWAVVEAGQTGVGRKTQQFGIAVGIVAVGKMPPDAPESKDLAEL